MLSTDYKNSIGRIVFLLMITSGLLLLASQFLGPGLSDFTKHVLNEYKYGDNGGYEKFIGYRNEEGLRIVIDARVDEYRIDNDLLIVARKPREIYTEAEITKSRLLKICQLWIINTNTHQITKQGEIEYAGSCRMSLF